MLYDITLNYSYLLLGSKVLFATMMTHDTTNVLGTSNIFFKSEDSTLWNVAIHISLLVVNIKLNHLTAGQLMVERTGGEAVIIEYTG